MSITRVTKGENKTIIEKGWTVYTDEFEAYASQFSYFKADDGTVFGTPKTQEDKTSNYFIEGTWYYDNECQQAITHAVLGQVVYFQLKTQRITEENANVTMLLFDSDDGINDDPIGIREVNTDKTLGRIITEKPVVNNKIIYSLTLSEGLAGFIDDDYGDEIELYFKCSYKEDVNIKLPKNSNQYLIVELCDKNVILSYNNKHYGNCEFYRFRYDDFMRRHKHCAHMPPVYYFGEMRALSSWDFVSDLSEWWTPTLTEEMRQISVEVQTVVKQGNSYKPLPSTSYGFKYCVRFSQILMPRLTERGQAWLRDARYKLQLYMEKGVIDRNYIATYETVLPDIFENNFNDNFEKFNWETMSYEFDAETQIEYYKNIEIDNERFQDFAFATHPDAYDPRQMSYLPASDLLRVMSTPDAKEWLGASTWKQALIMAKNLDYQQITIATLEEIFIKYVLGNDEFR